MRTQKIFILGCLLLVACQTKLVTKPPTAASSEYSPTQNSSSPQLNPGQSTSSNPNPSSQLSETFNQAEPLPLFRDPVDPAFSINQGEKLFQGLKVAYADERVYKVQSENFNWESWLEMYVMRWASDAKLFEQADSNANSNLNLPIQPLERRAYVSLQKGETLVAYRAQDHIRLQRFAWSEGNISSGQVNLDMIQAEEIARKAHLKPPIYDTDFPPEPGYQEPMSEYEGKFYPQNRYFDLIALRKYQGNYFYRLMFTQRPYPEYVNGVMQPEPETAWNYGSVELNAQTGQVLDVAQANTELGTQKVYFAKEVYPEVSVRNGYLNYQKVVVGAYVYDQRGIKLGDVDVLLEGIYPNFRKFNCFTSYQFEGKTQYGVCAVSQVPVDSYQLTNYQMTAHKQGYSSRTRKVYAESCSPVDCLGGNIFVFGFPNEQSSYYQLNTNFSDDVQKSLALSTHPEIEAFSPRHVAPNIPVNASIELIFSEEVNHPSVESSIRLQLPQKELTATDLQFEWSRADLVYGGKFYKTRDKLRITPKQSWPQQSEVKIQFDAKGFKDISTFRSETFPFYLDPRDYSEADWQSGFSREWVHFFTS